MPTDGRAALESFRKADGKLDVAGALVSEFNNKQ